ncbi:hypothetical protein PHYSODRAFT_323233, partial [Phytophthora sojae]
MSNSPTPASRPGAQRGYVVRLECPHELDDGAWDGPIYVRLQEPRYLQPGDSSVFLLDDSSRRPGWLCQLIFYPREFDTSPP